MRSKAKAWRTGEQRYRWTEEEARRVLAELTATGESVAAFCRRTGISRARLTYWQKRVSPRLPTTDFVSVDLAGVAGAKWFELVAGGVVLRVREELDVDLVARLVEAVSRRMGGAC